MATSDELQTGHFYWCSTLRSNLGKEFSDKEYRPVLLVKPIGYYAAIYPCSTTFTSRHVAEPLGTLFQEELTYLIYGYGLFYIPLADLHLPGIAWEHWTLWQRTHATLIEAHLARLQQQHGATLRTPLVKPTSQTASLEVPLSERLQPEVVRRLSQLQQPSKTLQKRSVNPQQPARKEPSDDELFQKALEVLPPYSRKDEDALPFPSTHGKKRRKR